MKKLQLIVFGILMLVLVGHIIQLRNVRHDLEKQYRKAECEKAGSFLENLYGDEKCLVTFRAGLPPVPYEWDDDRDAWVYTSEKILGGR